MSYSPHSTMPNLLMLILKFRSCHADLLVGLLSRLGVQSLASISVMTEYVVDPFLFFRITDTCFLLTINQNPTFCSFPLNFNVPLGLTCLLAFASRSTRRYPKRSRINSIPFLPSYTGSNIAVRVTPSC